MTLRGTLLSATRDLHARVDTQAGPLDDPKGYGAYLVATHAFRAAIEPALARAEAAGLSGDWTSPALVPQLRKDLSDLGLTAANLPEAPALACPAAVAGALYVTEGSALGARLIARRAGAQGYDGTFAARHLARQCAEPGRWRRFLDWLERTGADPVAATMAANATFALALAAYAVGGEQIAAQVGGHS